MIRRRDLCAIVVLRMIADLGLVSYLRLVHVVYSIAVDTPRKRMASHSNSQSFAREFDQALLSKIAA